MRRSTFVRLFAAVGLLLLPVATLSQDKKEQATPPAKTESGKPAKPAAGQDEKKPAGDKKPASDKPDAKGEQKPAGAPPGEMSPEMQAAMQAAQPGPAHAKLAKLAGEWTSKSKLAAPGEPSEESEGSGPGRWAVGLLGKSFHRRYTGSCTFYRPDRAGRCRDFGPA